MDAKRLDPSGGDCQRDPLKNISDSIVGQVGPTKAQQLLVALSGAIGASGERFDRALKALTALNRGENDGSGAGDPRALTSLQAPTGGFMLRPVALQAACYEYLRSNSFFDKQDLMAALGLAGVTGVEVQVWHQLSSSWSFILYPEAQQSSTKRIVLVDGDNYWHMPMPQGDALAFSDETFVSKGSPSRGRNHLAQMMLAKLKRVGSSLVLQEDGVGELIFS